MLNLTALFDTTLAHLGGIFSLLGIGDIIGCILGGYLFDRCNQEILFIVTHAVSMTAYIMGPWAGNLYMFALIVVVYEMARCIIETGLYNIYIYIHCFTIC